MKFAHEAIKVHCKAQMELMEEVGKTVKREYCHEENDEDLRKAVHDACYEKAYAIANQATRTNTKEEMLSMLFAEELQGSVLRNEELGKKKGSD